MKKRLAFGLFLALTASCGDELEQSSPPGEKSEVWVCHNPHPLSELHGSICVEEVGIYKGRHQPCYWVNGERIKDSFCWLLEKDDCAVDPRGSQRLEWQEAHCSLLEK